MAPTLAPPDHRAHVHAVDLDANLQRLAAELTPPGLERAELLKVLRGFVSLGATDREQVRRVLADLVAEQRRARAH